LNIISGHLRLPGVYFRPPETTRKLIL